MFHPGVHTTEEWRRPITVTLGSLEFDMAADEARKLATQLCSERTNP